MNLQAYADHRKAQGLRGHSHVAVLKAIESGRLTAPAVRKVGTRWLIDPAAADAQWAGNTDTARQPIDSRPAGTSRQPHPASGGPSLAEAKRARAVYQAERERLAVMREKGELVLAGDVKQEAARLARQVRDLLLMIPSRNAAKVATMQDAEEIRALLQAEIESAMRGLANA
ncbi:MAG: hypothetical protein ACO3GP_04330 [Candidatus Limnocylindrus sp.]